MFEATFFYDTWWLITVIIAWVVHTVWLLLSFMLFIQKSLGRAYTSWISRMKGILQPFYLPGLTISTIHTYGTTETNIYTHLGTLVAYTAWWMYKGIGDDNDKWKKLLRELGEKVTVTPAGRLAVVRED